MGSFKKKDLSEVDNFFRASIKRTCHLPADASNNYVYGAASLGLLGVPILAEESDTTLIDSAFKLLTSKDPAIFKIAWDDLQAFVSNALPLPSSLSESCPRITLLILKSLPIPSNLFGPWPGWPQAGSPFSGPALSQGSRTSSTKLVCWEQPTGGK